jgi:hypothetical protein
MLTAHPYNNPVPRETIPWPVRYMSLEEAQHKYPSSRECEVGGELPPARIAAMLIALMAATMAVSSGMAMVLDAWWPYVAGAVACFIIAKTA